jgi:hypothetical protein
MTIQLAPEMESQVARVAAAKGMAPDTYVQRAVAEALAWERSSPQPGRKEGLLAFVERLTQGSPDVPAHQTATFDREMIYSDDMEKFDL